MTHFQAPLLLTSINYSWTSAQIRKLGKYVQQMLLFRRSEMSLDAQEQRLATSPYLVTTLHLPHAIEVRLHVRKINVVIIPSLETVGTVGV